MIEIIKSLNWAQLGIALCGIGIVVFTLFSAGIQSQEQKKYASESKQTNQTLIDLSERHFELTQEIDDRNQNQILQTQSPDIRIKQAVLVDNGKIIQFLVHNYGSSTAENVSLELNYAYSSKMVIKKRELPPGEPVTFRADLFPLESSPVMAKHYALLKAEVFSGEKALIIHIIVKWDWNNESHKSDEYTIVTDKNRLLLF